MGKFTLHIWTSSHGTYMLSLVLFAHLVRLYEKGGKRYSNIRFYGSFVAYKCLLVVHFILVFFTMQLRSSFSKAFSRSHKKSKHGVSGGSVSDIEGLERGESSAPSSPQLQRANGESGEADCQSTMG